VTSSQTNFLNRYSFTDVSRPRPFSRPRIWLCEHRDSCGRRVHTVALCLGLVNMYLGPAQILLRPCSGYAQDAHPRLRLKRHCSRPKTKTEPAKEKKILSLGVLLIDFISLLLPMRLVSLPLLLRRYSNHPRLNQLT
jgi:hypothetical protein